MSGGGPSGGSTTSTSSPATIAPELQPLVSASTAGTIAGQQALPLTGTPTGTYYDPQTGLPTTSPYGAFTTLNPMQVPGMTSQETGITNAMAALPFDPNLMTPFQQAGDMAAQVAGPLSGQADYLAMKDDFTRNIAPLVESTAVGKGFEPNSGAMLESLSNAAAGAVAPLASQQQQIKAGLVPALTGLGAAAPATLAEALKQGETGAALPRTIATQTSQADYNAYQQLLDMAKQLTLGPTQTVLPGMITAGPSTTTSSSPSGFSK